jgi:hypothetical protein
MACMLDYLAILAYLSVGTAIVGVVLAVAFEVPLLEIFLRDDTPGGHTAAVVISVPFAIAAGLDYWGGVHWPIAVLWPVMLGHLWTCIGWRLRNTAP